MPKEKFKHKTILKNSVHGTHKVVNFMIISPVYNWSDSKAGRILLDSTTGCKLAHSYYIKYNKIQIIQPNPHIEQLVTV